MMNHLLYTTLVCVLLPSNDGSFDLRQGDSHAYSIGSALQWMLIFPPCHCASMRQQCLYTSWSVSNLSVFSSALAEHFYSVGGLDNSRKKLEPPMRRSTPVRKLDLWGSVQMIQQNRAKLNLIRCANCIRFLPFYSVQLRC
jgi:hypothetical protein